MKIFLSIFFLTVLVWGDIDYKKEIESLKNIGSKVFDQNEAVDMILVDFWASWCEPCKEGFPYYEGKIKSQKNKKVVLISVNLDDTIDAGKTFLKSYPQDNVIVWDEKKKFMKELGFDAIPMMIVLDKNWKEIGRIKGFNSESKKKLDKFFLK